jgi:hypothetical protein
VKNCSTPFFRKQDINSVGALVTNAQARHFNRWLILGYAGPVDEISKSFLLNDDWIYLYKLMEKNGGVRS